MSVDPDTFTPGMYIEMHGEEHIVLTVEADKLNGSIFVVQKMGDKPVEVSKYAIRNDPRVYVLAKNFPSVWERLDSV